MTDQAPLQAEQPEPEEEKRQRAIDLYIVGESPTTICRELGRSRTWFYKTLRRYQSGGREALRKRSRAPHRVHNRTPEEIEAAVERVRKAIAGGKDPELRYANLGADTIAVELNRARLTPPSRATINRILRRRNLAQPRPRRKDQQRLPVDYPWPQVQYPNQQHLFDFVSRRLIGGECVVGYHLLDQARRWPYLAAWANKTKVLVSQFLVAAWQSVGLPQALYIDNDVVWRGSSSAQRTFSYIVRLCLHLGVEVIFTPPYTPRANPIIESFNNVWSRNFWQRETFSSLADVQTKLPNFQHYCQQRRVLYEFDGRTANLLYPDFEPIVLSQDFTLPDCFPLTAGRIHFIRFVSQQGRFSILNEAWDLDPEQWADKTIRASILLPERQLHIYHQKDQTTPPELIAQFDYQVSASVNPLAKEFQRDTVSLWPVSEAVPSKV